MKFNLQVCHTKSSIPSDQYVIDNNPDGSGELTSLQQRDTSERNWQDPWEVAMSLQKGLCTDKPMFLDPREGAATKPELRIVPANVSAQFMHQIRHVAGMMPPKLISFDTGPRLTVMDGREAWHYGRPRNRDTGKIQGGDGQDGIRKEPGRKTRV